MSSKNAHDDHPKVQRIGFLLGVAGLVFAAYLIVHRSAQPSRSSKAGEQIAAASSANLTMSSRRPQGTTPIEEIRVGDRVLARNPEVSDAERTRWQVPDWADWLHLHLVMDKDDGSKLDIELLRPESWVLKRLSYVSEERASATSTAGVDAIADDDSQQSWHALQREGPQRATRVDSDPLSPLRPFYRDVALTSAELAACGADLIGITLTLDLPEMGAMGTALVTAVDPCPPIKDGAGQPVTATFAHQASTEVLDILFEGEASPIGVTDNHLFWSVDDRQFVAIGQMNIGDRVQTYSGETKRIAGKLPRPGPQVVYNLEVYGEHVYFVGQQGLLAHNLYEANGNVVYTDAFDELLPTPSAGAFGGVIANTAEEASFLRNVDATFRDGSVFNSAARHRGNIVVQRSDIPLSTQNLRRMLSGNSPFVRNTAGEWEPLNLHHVGRQDGKLIEVFSSHNTYNPMTGGPLHIPGPGGPVRQSKLSQTYWRQRADDLIDSGQVSDDVLRQLGR